MTENGKLPEKIILLLFDQVNKASCDNTEQLRNLTEAVNKLTEHTKEKNKEIQNLTNISKEVDLTSKSVLTRLSYTIIAVLVAFSILTVAYLFVRATIDSTIKKSIEKHYNTSNEHGDLYKEIEKLREDLETVIK